MNLMYCCCIYSKLGLGSPSQETKVDQQLLMEPIKALLPNNVTRLGGILYSNVSFMA